MWEQYKKTLPATQSVIAFVTVAVTLWTRAWNAGAMFFVVMQMGAILGAMWAVRLKHKVERALRASPPA